MTPIDLFILGAGFGIKLYFKINREKFIVACLDTKNQPVSIEGVSAGSVNSAIVHPREVFKTAVLTNVSKTICFHKHPSGNATISKEDESITERLSKSGEILGIELVDHIIVGDNDTYFSFK